MNVCICYLPLQSSGGWPAALALMFQSPSVLCPRAATLNTNTCTNHAASPVVMISIMLRAGQVTKPDRKHDQRQGGAGSPAEVHGGERSICCPLSMQRWQRLRHSLKITLRGPVFVLQSICVAFIIIIPFCHWHAKEWACRGGLQSVHIDLIPKLLHCQSEMPRF